MGICVVCDYWGSACKASKHHGIVDGKVNVFAWCETEKYWRNERIGIATAMEDRFEVEHRHINSSCAV